MKVITIDGLSASGKSTVAKLVAEQLGWAWVSTGLSFRNLAVGKLRRLGVADPHDPRAAARAARLARNPHLREQLRRIWRRLPRPLVADGRDAGTHTWPSARLKLWLEAPLGWRALQRWRAVGGSEPAHRLALLSRDRADRAMGHRPARDAVRIRSDAWSAEQIADLAVRLWRCRSER